MKNLKRNSMLTHNPDNNLVGGCNKHPGQSFLNCYYCMLDNNLVGQEPKKEVKNKQTPNIWIDVSEYKPDLKHILVCDCNPMFTLAKVKSFKDKLSRYFEIMKVKRVMILSRK